MNEHLKDLKVDGCMVYKLGPDGSNIWSASIQTYGKHRLTTQQQKEIAYEIKKNIDLVNAIKGMVYYGMQNPSEAQEMCKAIHEMIHEK